MNDLKKILISILLLTNLSACNTSPTKATEIPTVTATSVTQATPSPTPTSEPTVKPTEAVSIIRPEAGKDTAIQYTQEQLDLIYSGKFQEDEKVIAGWFDYWRTGKPETGELSFKAMPLIYIYFFDTTNPENLDHVIVALESPDYPNTAILPPIDFTKSKGLHVEFMESLPYEKDGHSIPSYLMPTFLTIDANEESVASGKMQERFIHTTFTNIGGEPVRINSEGKVVAKIGVKPETQEAKWVRELCTDYSNPDNYTPVTIEEIRSGQILYDEEVQAEPFPEDVVFPSRFEMVIQKHSGTLYARDSNDKFYNKYIRNVFFYEVVDEDVREELGFYLSIISQQIMQKDGTWSFLKRSRGWIGNDASAWTKDITPGRVILPTFYLSEEGVPIPQYWNILRRVSNDKNVLSKNSESEKLFTEYKDTGFIPDKLKHYIIPGIVYSDVKDSKDTN